MGEWRQITENDQIDRINVSMLKITNTVKPAKKSFTPLFFPVRIDHLREGKEKGQGILHVDSRMTRAQAESIFNHSYKSRALSALGKCDFSLELFFL